MCNSQSNVIYRRSKLFLTNIIAIFFLFSISACSSNTPKETNDITSEPRQEVSSDETNEGNNNNLVDESLSTEPEVIEVVEPEPTEESFSIGDTITLGDWELVLNSFEVSDAISNTFGAFHPEEGNKFVIIDLTVKNNGTSSDTFLSSFAFGNEDVISKIMYKGQYEFTPSTLLGHENDLHDKSLNPLSSTTGIVAYDIVDEAANSDELEFVLSLGKQTVTFDLK